MLEAWAFINVVIPGGLPLGDCDRLTLGELSQLYSIALKVNEQNEGLK